MATLRVVVTVQVNLAAVISAIAWAIYLLR